MLPSRSDTGVVVGPETGTAVEFVPGVLSISQSGLAVG